MPKRIDAEVKARAVRLVTEHQQEYPNLTAACQAAGRKVGVGAESVRRWVRQAEIDNGDRHGMTTAMAAENRELKRKNRELEQTIEVLKAATSFFVRESDPPRR